MDATPVRLGQEFGGYAAQVDLGRAEVTDLAEHVVQLVGAAGTTSFAEALQLELEVGEHAGVQQLAQLLRAEQVAQQIPVEREGCRPPLGERRVALVHEIADVRKQQRRGER